MPVYNSNILPATAGLSLGGPLQEWNASLASVTCQSLAINPAVGQTYAPSFLFQSDPTVYTVNANVTTYQTLSSFTIPANLLNKVGRVIRVRWSGSYTTQAGQTPQISFSLAFGSTQLTAPISQGLTASVTERWNVIFEGIVLQGGMIGLFEPFSSLAYGPLTGNTVIDGSSLATVGPFDLTVARTLTTQALFTTNTSPANVFRQRSIVIEVLG